MSGYRLAYLVALGLVVLGAVAAGGRRRRRWRDQGLTCRVRQRGLCPPALGNCQSVDTNTTGTPTAELPGGVSMPMLGLGTWSLRGEQARQAIGWAFGAGYRHLDTATMYGNERQVGAAVRESGVPREDVFVTTKLPPDHAGREEQTIRQSLRALDMDYVDLWLVHWPPGGRAGVETWREFVRVRDDGRARAIGVSNYSLAQIDELVEATGVTPAVNQVRWSPFQHDAAFLQGCRERGVVLEGYSPFKAGRLDHGVLTEVANRHGRDAAQVVVRWHLQHGIVVIPKSARHERIVSNAQVLDFALTPDEMATLDALSADR